MDEADASEQAQQITLDIALKKRRASLPAIGRCYSCDEVTDNGRRFCDRDCLEDWERAEKARRIGGRGDE